MNMNQKGFAPIIIALIVALLLGVGGYAVVKQRENKKAEVKLISTDIFKNATYRIAFSAGKVRGIPTEFTMTGGFSSNSIKDFPLCNISGLGIKNELAIATIDQSQARGVVAIDCSYGASFIDVFLAAFKNLNGVPVQTDAVDLRLHPDLSSRNLSQVGVKQIALDANGALAVTALVIPDALRNASTVQQSASESVTISYSLDNQGKLTPTPTSVTVTSNWKTYTNTQYGFSIQYPKDANVNNVGSDGEGSNNVLFTLPRSSQGSRIFTVSMQTKAFYNLGTPSGVLRAPANCKFYDENYKEIIPSQVNINGVDFVKSDTSGAATAQRASATEYCVLKGETAYKLTPLIEYARRDDVPGGFDPNIDVNKDSVLNQMVSTFKFTTPKVSDETANWKKYSDTSLEFEYPSLLSVKKDGQTITLSHSIAYQHADPCDFKGGAPSLNRLSDFSVSLTVVNKNLKDLVQSSTYPGWDYVSKNPFKLGSLNGFKVNESIEGCGKDVYYFTLSPTKTLVIDRSLITEFSSIIKDYQTYLNLSGIISPNQAEEFFTKIISSLILAPSPTLTPEKKQAANCVNKKFGYQLIYPTGWKVWTRGDGEARSATCSENLAAYFFAEDLFGTPFKNQINLIVSTRDNQVKEFWQGINSLDDYVKSLSAWKVQKETTINGERLVWLEYNQGLKLVAYHNSAIYEFSIYSVDSITLDKFLASFEFTK